MKIEKLTESEVSSVKEIQKLRAELIDKYGLIEMSIQDLKLQKQEVTEELKEIKITELKLSQELQSKYGVGTINIDSGEFIGNE
jgi:transcription-repair coupling factor (superfamily II helicase)